MSTQAPLETRRVKRLILRAVLMLAVCLASTTIQFAQVRSVDPLQGFNDSIDALIRKVAPSVVQILVTSYGPLEESQRGNTGVVIGRQRSMGSGFVIDSEGYIITNAHVVNAAQRIQIVLPSTNRDGAIATALSPKTSIVPAQIVGVARDIDLALLKIEGVKLPALPLAGYRNLRQGELVFAFGSPIGLRNTVTHGMVSAVARQNDPDSPLISIQTDAPINPGNSGGPLMNIKGEVVGVNSFILSQSGGNEGLGFAIPSATVRVAYRQLKQFGHLRRQEIGIAMQTITPVIAAGLGLTKDFGVIISDVLPGSPAEAAGIKDGDILLSVDGQPADNLPTASYYFLLRDSGDKVQIEVLRGSEHQTFSVPVVEERHDFDQLMSLVNPAKSVVAPLGILGVEVDTKIVKMVPELRNAYGVIVAARTTGAAGELPLAAGDVIRSLNGRPMTSLDRLRTALAEIKPGDPIVMQIQREGKLMYISSVLE